MSSTEQSIAARAPAVVAPAVLLVVPGTALSIAFSAIGGIMLVALGVDWMAHRNGAGDGGRPRRFPVVAQLGIGVGAAAAVGGAIALGAWIIQ